MEILVRNYTVRLYPNKHMESYLNQCFGYRRYIWNQALGLWNDEYDVFQVGYGLSTKSSKVDKAEFLKYNSLPSYYQVRKIVFQDKQDWEYNYPNHLADSAIRDLKNAFTAFFDKKRPDSHHPKFRSRKANHQGFKLDRIKIVNGKLHLGKGNQYPKELFYDIRIKGLPTEMNQYQPCLASVWTKNGQYFATLTFKDLPEQPIHKSCRATAVDLNVSHFNYLDEHHQQQTLNVLPKKLIHLYQENKVLHRALSRRNPKSKRYLQTKTKLQRNYVKITNIQNDRLHKFTTMLSRTFSKVVIEDLDVKKMLMSHVASKGMHRASFGKFRQLLTYKMSRSNRSLIIADRHYASTQICHFCKEQKQGKYKITLQGNVIDETTHDQYQCDNQACLMYHQIQNRDENAVMNLLQLAF